VERKVWVEDPHHELSSGVEETTLDP
jgi:hypothetical protein